MTFYEAALQILQREGKPLHARDITELAIKENLLSHVGKQPEITMASRLAAMARRSQDRRLVAVEPDIFGLSEWDVPVVAEALEQSGLPEVHDEEEAPLRARERHPKIDKENVRVAGRGDRRRKYEEAERKKKKKKKRLPPLAELVYEILDRTGRPVPAFELAAAIREWDLIGEDIGREALEKALREENERRETEGRSAVFSLDEEERLVGLAGRAAPADEEVDLPALVASTVAKIAAERKPAEAPPPVALPAAAAAAMPSSIDALVAESRGRAIRAVRQKLLDLDGAGLESVASSLLDVLGYRDVRVAKRHKEGALFTTRRRMGLTEIRFAVRVIRGSREVRREDVLELRRDLASHSAQMGILLSPSDATREARSEVGQPGQALVTLLCADALAEQMVERNVGVAARTVTLVEFDPEGFGKLLRRAAPASEGPVLVQESQEDRRARREKERREWRERREREREERRRARMEKQAAARAAEEARLQSEPAAPAQAEQAATTEPVDTAAAAAPEARPAETVAAPTESESELAPPVEAPEAPVGAERPVFVPRVEAVGAETPVYEPTEAPVLGAEAPLIERESGAPESAEPGIAAAGAAGAESVMALREGGAAVAEEELAEEPEGARGRSRRRRRPRGAEEGAGEPEGWTAPAEAVPAEAPPENEEPPVGE